MQIYKWCCGKRPDLAATILIYINEELGGNLRFEIFNKIKNRKKQTTAKLITTVGRMEELYEILTECTLQNVKYLMDKVSALHGNPDQESL